MNYWKSFEMYFFNKVLAFLFIFEKLWESVCIFVMRVVFQKRQYPVIDFPYQIEDVDENFQKAIAEDFDGLNHTLIVT